MRDKNMPASFGELVGKVEGKDEKDSLSMDDLKELLGPKMPELPHNSVGRVRLVQTLQERFGANWRQLPALKKLVADFDQEIKTKAVIARVKGA